MEQPLFSMSHWHTDETNFLPYNYSEANTQLYNYRITIHN